MALYRCELRSTLAVQAVLDRMRGLTRQRPGFWQSIKEPRWRHPAGSTPFVGEIEGNRFSVHRDIRYRNSFLPRIKGHVYSSIGGSTVTVTMYLHPFVVVFLILWLGGVGAAAIAMLKIGKSIAALLPIGMSVLGVAVALYGFYPEAIEARRILARCIAAADGRR